MKGPDHHFSSNPESFKEYCSSIKNLSKMIGSGNIDYSKNETHARKNYGISCVAKMDIETAFQTALAITRKAQSGS